MENLIFFRQPLCGASLSQELIGVVYGARLQLFWGFLRFFVAGSRVFQGMPVRFVSEGVIRPSSLVFDFIMSSS